MNPTNYTEKVERAAYAHNIPLEPLYTQTADALRRKLNDYLIGERHQPYCKIEKSDAWMLIREYVQNNSAILFFDVGITPTMFRLQNGHDLHHILWELSWAPNYVTDIEGRYLLEYTSEDQLIAYKDAVDWLKAYPAAGKAFIECCDT